MASRLNQVRSHLAGYSRMYDSSEEVGRRALGREKPDPGLSGDNRAIMSEVRMIGSALITILIIALVLNEVFNALEWETDAEGNYEGPFGPLVGDLETTGVAAMGLLIVGLLIAAAVGIMRLFQGGFGAR